jgi:hypothetical protein
MPSTDGAMGHAAPSSRIRNEQEHKGLVVVPDEVLPLDSVWKADFRKVKSSEV